VILAVKIAFRYHVADAIHALLSSSKRPALLLGFQRVGRQAHLRHLGIGIWSQRMNGSHVRILVFSPALPRDKAVDKA